MFCILVRHVVLIIFNMAAEAEQPGAASLAPVPTIFFITIHRYFNNNYAGKCVRFFCIFATILTP
jgi:hypothetical protein